MCRQNLLRAVHARWWLSDVHKPRLIWIVHRRRRLTIVYAKDYKGTRCPTSARLFVQDIGNARRPNLEIVEWSTQATTNAASPHPTLPKRCAYTMGDGTNEDQLFNGSCHLSLAKIACPKHTCLRWWFLPLANAMLPYWYAYTTIDACRPLLIFPGVGQRWLHEVHKPWLMLPDIGRCKFLPTNRHMPWSMCASLCWFCISLSNISYRMCIFHVDAWKRWMMYLVVVRPHLAYTLSSRPMSPSRCARTTAHECRPWLMMHVVGRRRLPYEWWTIVSRYLQCFSLKIVVCLDSFCSNFNMFFFV